MSFINPFRTYTCLFCFRPIKITECQIVAHDGTTITRRPGNMWERIVAWCERLVSWFWVPTLHGEIHTDYQAARKCRHCEELLPYNFERLEHPIIALVGPHTSGKSHYIASLIYSLKGMERRRVGSVGFTALNAQVEERYRTRYFQPFIEEKNLLPGTLPTEVPKPIIYTMKFGSGDNVRSIRSINLVLFDVAGELLQDEVERTKQLKYIQSAAAIIFLIDPLSIPKIRAAMPDPLQPDYDPYTNPDLLITSVINNFARYHSLPENSALSIPAVIAIAKSDLLKYAVADPEPHFLKDYKYENGFIQSELSKVHKEIETILTQTEQPGLLDAAYRFESIFYCAVSAAGTAPDKETHKFPFVKPLRCLDPLFWILFRLGYIEPVPEPQPEPDATDATDATQTVGATQATGASTTGS